MAHQEPSSAEVSSSHGGTQRNGDHCFLWGEERCRRILVATHLFHLNPHHCFFKFFSFLNCSTIYYFWQFSGPKLSESFWGPKRHFSASNGEENMSLFWSRYFLFVDVVLELIFLMMYHVHQTEVVCQSYDPGKLMYQVTQQDPYSGVSPPRVRFLDV